MSRYYQAEVHVTKQEDGLWRLYVPNVQGAWVDAKTLEEGFSDLQEAIALAVSYYQEHGWPLPSSVSEQQGLPVKASLPFVLEEYAFTSRPVASAKTKRR